MLHFVGLASAEALPGRRAASSHHCPTSKPECPIAGHCELFGDGLERHLDDLSVVQRRRCYLWRNFEYLYYSDCAGNQLGKLLCEGDQRRRLGDEQQRHLECQCPAGDHYATAKPDGGRSEER